MAGDLVWDKEDHGIIYVASGIGGGESGIGCFEDGIGIKLGQGLSGIAQFLHEGEAFLIDESTSTLRKMVVTIGGIDAQAQFSVAACSFGKSQGQMSEASSCAGAFYFEAAFAAEEIDACFSRAAIVGESLGEGFGIGADKAG